MLVALFTEMIVPANGLVATVALPVPWLTMMYFPTSPAGAAALTKLAPASVSTACPDAPVPPVPIFPSPSAPYAATGNCQDWYSRFASAAAVTTCTTVNPDACTTGALPSAPRITVHVVPDTACTASISDGWAGSATWNCCAPNFTAANDADDATVHDSTVPPAGADVPPEETVVDGLLAKTSSGMKATAQPSSSQVNSSQVALENPVFVATVIPTMTVCGMFVTRPVAVCCTVLAAAVCGMMPCVKVVSVAGRYDLPCPITCALVALTSGDVSARTCRSHSRYHGAAVSTTAAVDAVSPRIAGVVAMLLVAVEFM